MGTKATKFVTAEEAVQAIRSRDEIVLANFCAEPRYLPSAVMDRAHELNGCRMFHLTPFGPFQEKYLEPGMEKHVRCAIPFCGRRKSVRQLIKEGRADFYPLSFANYPELLRTGDFKTDVFMLAVSSPNRDGYCSLGVSVDYAWACFERPARLVMAEINPNMPVTYGRSFIHMSDIDYAVEVDYPIFEFEQFEITDVEKRIGENVAGIVPGRQHVRASIQHGAAKKRSAWIIDPVGAAIQGICERHRSAVVDAVGVGNSKGIGQDGAVAARAPLQPPNPFVALIPIQGATVP